MTWDFKSVKFPEKGNIYCYIIRDPEDPSYVGYGPDNIILETFPDPDMTNFFRIKGASIINPQYYSELVVCITNSSWASYPLREKLKDLWKFMIDPDWDFRFLIKS